VFLVSEVKAKIQEMIERVVKKIPLRKEGNPRDELNFWRTQSVEARLSAVENLRRQADGNTARLQRTAKIIQRSGR